MEVLRMMMKVDYVVNIVPFQLCQLNVVEFNLKSPCVMGPYSEDWARNVEGGLFLFCVLCIYCAVNKGDFMCL